MVTTSVLGDVVRQVVGSDAPVDVVMARGADPHSFEASPRQVAAMRSARLLVVNGGGLESGLLDTIAAARSAGVHVFTALDHVATIEFGVHGGPDRSAELPAGGVDPHFWLDPSRTERVVDALATELATLDPAHADGYRTRGHAYSARLAALDREVAAQVATVPVARRELVTNHDAFGYFADRYGFRIVGVVVPGGSTLAQPGSSELAALAAAVRREHVPAVFAENTQPARLADALAREVGDHVEVVELYTGALGPADSPAGTYLGMIRTDASRITAALR